MKKTKVPILYILLGALLTLIGCEASPPIAPKDDFNPFLAPNAPAQVKASNGLSDTIELTWENVEGATGYMVWATVTEDYGTVIQDTSITDAYSKLMARGFKLLDVVTEPNYKLKDLKSDTSYIFSVVAMKSIASKSSTSTTTLYSDPSAFVQGSTASQVMLSAIANSKTVTLYWDVTNLHSALDDSKDPLSLYDYEISVYKKLSAKNDWGEGTVLDKQSAKSQSFAFPATTLELDTAYDFKIHVDILSADGEIINSVESQTFRLTTDSLPVPDSVENLSSNKGKKRNELTLTWTAPTLANHDEITSTFIIDRAEGSVEANSTLVRWTEITAPVVQNEDGTYSVTDTTLEDNKTYTYRIVNGYQRSGKTTSYQNKVDSAVIQGVYSLWMPTDITFSFTENSTTQGTLEVNYTYNPPEPQGAVKTYIGHSTWTEEDLDTKTEPTEEETSTSGSSVSYQVDLAQERPLTYFSFYFRLTVDDQEIVKLTSPKDFTLGVTAAASDLIESFSATQNWVRAIRLSWQEEKTDGTYEYDIYKDNVKLSDSDYTIASDSSNSQLKSVLLSDISDGQNNNFRIKAYYTPSTGTEGTSYQVAEAQGTTLDIPTGLSATDGTSISGITVTWPQIDDANVNYVLKYSEDNGTSWKGLSTSTGTTPEGSTEGSAFLTAKNDGTDGNKILFKLEVSNSTQNDSSKPLESAEESGSVFGPALLNVRIENNGLDPDKITIKWDKIEGASTYKVLRGTTQLAQKKDANTYEDLVDNLKVLSGESPLNEEYTYTIIPCLPDGTEAKVTAASTTATATGKLFAPPTNVSATKGQDGISLSWDAVDNATGYEIQKYIITLKNGKVVNQVFYATDTTTSTTYEERTSGLLDQIVLYKLRSIKADGTASQWQEHYKTVTNSLGFDEAMNIGYRLQAPTNISVSSVVNSGYYANYVKVTWYAVPGATSYTLTSNTSSGKLATTTVSVDSLSYSETDIVDNGVSGAGYLRYDPEYGLYTYYDGAGALKASYVINSYSIIASNGSANSTTTTKDNISVYRQPNAKEWVNIVANILKPAFIAANSNFGGDWWIDNALAWKSPTNSYTYPNTGMVFNLKTDGISTDYPCSSNYLSISSYKDSTTRLTLATTANIQFDITGGGGAGNLGTDSLNLIGKNGNGAIKVTPEDSKLKAFTIKYTNVTVYSVGGTYSVTISGSSEQQISDSSDITRLLGN